MSNGLTLDALTKLLQQEREQTLKEQRAQFQQELKALQDQLKSENEEARKERDALKEELCKVTEKLNENRIQVTDEIHKILNLPVAKPFGRDHKGRPLIVIDDLPEDCPYSEEEKDARRKLAALFRLVDDNGWSYYIYNHITLTIPGTDYILINPYGLLYHEITASSLVKITVDGQIVDRGTTKYGINRNGYIIHSAIHEARPEVRCTIHVHHFAVAGVSAMKCGLMPICQEAMVAGPIAYAPYEGVFANEEDKEKLRKLVKEDMRKKVLLLRNHGCVTMGETAEEAFRLLFVTINACETQAKSLVVGEDRVEFPTKEGLEQVYNYVQKGATSYDNKDGKAQHGVWKYGEFEWEAFMRDLDSRGFKTGHKYQAPR